MAMYHTVEQGEHLSSIAKDHGFTDYHAIWNHPGNAELKKKRQNPNVLFPGDNLFIPDRQLREEFRSTDQRHRFKMRGPVLKLRLVLEDLFEKPIANAQCVLVLENNFHNVTTDGKGRIDRNIPTDAHTAGLVIHDAQTPLAFVQIPIRIGDLDPVEEISANKRG